MLVGKWTQSVVTIARCFFSSPGALRQQPLTLNNPESPLINPGPRSRGCSWLKNKVACSLNNPQSCFLFPPSSFFTPWPLRKVYPPQFYRSRGWWRPSEVYRDRLSLLSQSFLPHPERQNEQNLKWKQMITLHTQERGANQSLSWFIFYISNSALCTWAAGSHLFQSAFYF